MVRPTIVGEDIVCSQFERLWWLNATAGSSVPIKLFSKNTNDKRDDIKRLKKSYVEFIVLKI